MEDKCEAECGRRLANAASLSSDQKTEPGSRRSLSANLTNIGAGSGPPYPGPLRGNHK
jgi:hypothetical protein